jgi:hypothetical protein
MSHELAGKSAVITTLRARGVGLRKVRPRVGRRPPKRKLLSPLEAARTGDEP